MNALDHEPKRLRTLVHEVGYVEAVGKIFASVERADKVLEALEYFVSRRPDLGMAIEGYPREYGTWISKPLGKDQRVRILFHISDENIHLLDAWIVKDLGIFGRG